MKKGYYSRTDVTYKAINEAKKIIKKTKEENPNMTWEERNKVSNEIAKKYENDDNFQQIMYGDSIVKWWHKNYE